MITDEAVEAAARGIKAAQCFGREGPFGRYDYTSYGWEKPHRIRDFRDPNSETWGADVYKSDDAVACELEFDRLTEQHIARAALEAALPHLLASQGCGTGHSGEQREPAVGAAAALAFKRASDEAPVRDAEEAEQWLLTWCEETATYDLGCINSDWSHGEKIGVRPNELWAWVPPPDGGEAVHARPLSAASAEPKNTPAHPQKGGEG